MILRTIIWFSLLLELQCYPQPRRHPNLDVLSPQEVNSLEQDAPIARNFKVNKKTNVIEDAIQEVEELIKSDPKLPRLTRGEILDLVENITKTDAQKLNLLGKNRSSKAIMVVMPYTPGNDKNMEDLYTKAPVTHIISAEPFRTSEVTNETKHSRRRPPVQFIHEEHGATNDEVPTQTTPSRYQFRKIPEVTTDRTTNEVVPTTYHPRSENLKNGGKESVKTTIFPTTYHPTTTSTTPRPKTRRPLRRRTTTTEPRYSNHRYPEDLEPTGGIKIIESPNLSVPQRHRTAKPDQNVKPEVVTKPVIPPTIKPTPSTLDEIYVPDSLKNVVKDLNLEAALKPAQDIPKKPLDKQKRIKEMLASIGVIPESTSSTTTTTTTLMPNAENVAESLSPDMRELLMTFGLLPNPNEKPLPPENINQYYPETADVKADSYIGFKPLPDDGPTRGDMDALLASFGLGRSARKQKKLQNRENQTRFSLDLIPDDLKGVVGDLGLAESSREEKKISSSDIPNISEKQHIFNPDTQYATEEELKKLEKLMAVIKQLEQMNGTASEEDLKKINLEDLKELIGSLNGANNDTFVTLDEKGIGSPDPINFDEGVSKNEVKRQEENATAVATTEEPRTPSLVDLEASFGGQTEAVTVPPVPATTTRRTGFYYLVDWNTFLDIDDMKGKRVNLRFQPTIGDPKRFRAVSVP